MDDHVLDFLDDAARAASFEHYSNRLKSSSGRIDLDALRICIRLLPPSDKDETSHEKVVEPILHGIHEESNDPERLYRLAELCLGHASLGWRIFSRLLARLQLIGKGPVQDTDEPRSFPEDPTLESVSILNVFKCSFWLPAQQNHFITPGLVQLLVDFIGQSILEGPAHDALSALLSLLKSPTTILQPYDGIEAPAASSDGGVPKVAEPTSLIGQQVWTRIEELPPDYFTHESSRIFRTWFQWISHLQQNEMVLEGIYTPLYWSRLRAGLIAGFPEQRKYCLGILRQSLLLAKRNIDTSFMVLDITQFSDYLQQYDRYSTVFETIVLDRYPNQVQACLPELTSLLDTGSLIAQGWLTALLSAALHPTVQDAVRKLVGTWYIDFITRERVATMDHVEFLVQGFLPWATQGSLFTSSLSSTRDHTTCAHGVALSKVVSVSVSIVPTDVDRRQLLADTLHFVLDRGGRIFQYSIVYLLEGLLDGFEAQSAFAYVEATELDLVFRISRLTGLPEIASDLVTVYCAEFCNYATSANPSLENLSGRNALKSKYASLMGHGASQEAVSLDQQMAAQLNLDPERATDRLEQLSKSLFQQVQSHSFGYVCDEIMIILSAFRLGELQISRLHDVLEALWEEADRQEFVRPVAVRLPRIFLHSTCVGICVRQHSAEKNVNYGTSLVDLLVTGLDHLGRLSGGRPYLSSILAHSLREACFCNPQIMTILPIEEFLVRFIEHVQVPRNDYLFELAAAEKLGQILPDRNFSAYYGRREWHAYACIVDLLSRFPDDQRDVGKQVLQRLLEPWRGQKPPIPIVSKWKETFQLQAMLLLSDSCVSSSNAEWFLDSFMKALVVEQWPRYRYLLEWNISRIYYRHPELAQRILPDLAKLDDASPIHVASLMKVAVLTAPFVRSEAFTLQLMTLLIPFSASPKVQVRHEAHWSFPIVWDLAVQNAWTNVTGNPAFKALNDHIRTLDKFNSPASSIRTLKLDAVNDFNLTSIFQGAYLTIELPERELVHRSDFRGLWKEDYEDGLSARVPPSCIDLGDLTPDVALPTTLGPAPQKPSTTNQTPTAAAPPLQTKAGFDPSALLPATSLPSTTPLRPTSVILIASLIDHPTNLGGLSRISESFGLETLYIDDMKAVDSKYFQATAVNSHKHLPIKELKVDKVPEFLVDVKRKGYVVVALEQTDRSGMLGIDEAGGQGRGLGLLPKKCCLVLGSEKGGVTKEVLAVVDRCVEIKTVGVTRSLNVQTAGGIAMFEWWREWGGEA